jgi:HlyD family secretion protein
MTSTNDRNGGHHGGGKPRQPLLAPTSSLVRAESSAIAPAGSNQLVRTEAFDQPVILQQPAFWSRAIVWSIVGVTSFALIWAAVAKIEEAIPATGKLEPQGSVQEIQAPVGGVVSEILVEDGQRVQRGDLLLRLDPTAAQAQRRSLEQVRASLQQENQFYRAVLSGQNIAAAGLDLPAELLSLTASRAALVAENQLYQAQLRGATAGSLNAAQVDRLNAIRTEADSRTAAAALGVSQLQQQLSQTQGQLNVARETLAINQSILNDIQPLVDEGGLSRVQFLRQQTEVLNGQAEVDRLAKEEDRLVLAIEQANEQLQNTRAVSRTDLLSRVSENDKDIAEIDSQLNKAIVENEKQLADINSQLVQTQVALRDQELRAPVDGTVFDIQPKGTGFVANTSEPILKIVPGDTLVAEVNITNQDIGFVDEGMEVDVRIDSFPFSEFGDVKGELISIGSDALPPTEVLPFYHFPAQIQLDQQSLVINGREVPLQSGMSVTANIKTRQRTVMSIFTDLFVRKVDSLRTVR